jgi:hypothetical protein
MRHALHTGLFVTLVAASCASQAPGTQPVDMSAAEHRTQAQQHDAEGAKHEEQYQPAARATRRRSARLQNADVGESDYNPTRVHLGDAKDHREVAEAHRKAARALEAYTKAECGKFPPKTRAACPILSVVTEQQDLPNGAKLVMADGVAAKVVLEHMRCHHAFSGEEGYKGMSGCPLYLKSIVIGLGGDGKSVTVTSDDAETVKEIQKRAKSHASKSSVAN